MCFCCKKHVRIFHLYGSITVRGDQSEPWGETHDYLQIASDHPMHGRREGQHVLDMGSDWLHFQETTGSSRRA